MSHIIVVSIDSKSDTRNYDDLGERMTREEFLPFGSDCHVTKNTWCFQTDKNAAEVYDFLRRRVLYHDDDVFVGQLDGPWHTNGKAMSDCFKRPR